MSSLNVEKTDYVNDIWVMQFLPPYQHFKEIHQHCRINGMKGEHIQIFLHPPFPALVFLSVHLSTSEFSFSSLNKSKSNPGTISKIAHQKLMWKLCFCEIIVLETRIIFLCVFQLYLVS